jgi:hypothetical protein
MPYTVKNVKKFRGREGYGFNASLYRDGVNVALVMDDASGGMLRYEWKQNDRKEESLLAAYVATLPPVKYAGETMRMTKDIFIDELVNDFDAEKAFTRILKKTAFVTSDGKVRYMTRPRDPGDDAHVLSKYKGAVILNNLPTAEAFALFKKHSGHNDPVA